MKVKNGFKLREVCGEHIIVAEGDENIDFSNIISMNESSAFLWEEVQKRSSFTVEDLVELLCGEYEIDKLTARKDATALASQWGVAGIIEGEDIPEMIAENVGEEVQPSAEGISQEQQKECEQAPKKGLFRRIFG
ncbi:PqqD family protein [Prevotella multiformis]|uniref:PqqD family protein n=1 Tax=Prevotella multiformis TaxID=282402 RepID=UPI001BA7A3A9|nr:PqqD family protein [Prevotella multiformis]QUB71050.1 PqqD family protein [Prevotella multiformis]